VRHNQSSESPVGLIAPDSAANHRPASRRPPPRRPKRLKLHLGIMRITAAVTVRRVMVPPMQPLGLGVWAIRLMAAFAFLWSVFRAVTQSVTLDEADTYLWFSGGQSAKFIWYGFPNNHVLNSLLIWISTHCFGISALTVRLPALLGSALYIAIAYFLCRAIAGRLSLQLITFVCLVYNPFILDYFAAARGYGLADAFLLAALAIPLWHMRTHRWSVPACCALASAAVGLCFCSNFSFALVATAALLVVVLWGIAQRGRHSLLRIFFGSTWPAVAISGVMCGYTVTHYERTSLWYGARSLAEMTRSLIDASLYKLCDPFASYATLRSAGPFLLLALLVLCACRLIFGGVDRGFRQSKQAKMVAALCGILLFTLAAHFLAFRLIRLPLPMSRTAIYFLPLTTLLIAAIAASPAASPVSRWLGRAIVTVLFCLSAHYLLSLRYNYFKEYDQGAEMKQVYRIVDRLNRTYGIRDFTIDGAYASPLNFYRTASRNGSLPIFEAPPGMVPPGKPVYVIHGDFYAGFIDQHNLAVLYRGPVSRVAVAVSQDGPVPQWPVSP
jgi:hypothetical protein